MKTVFLDTNAFKFCTTEKLMYMEKPDSASYIHWKDPNENLPEPLRTQVSMLHEIFQKHAAQFTFQTSIEVHLESFRCTTLGGKKSAMENITVNPVSPPIELSRPLISKEYDISVFQRIRHPRFLELQRATGAYQGDRIDGNQLIDTFHIWTAENANCDYFLTLDLKLVRIVQGHKTHPPKTKVVSPQQLLEENGFLKGNSSG